jgi:hypothetical protein
MMIGEDMLSKMVCADCGQVPNVNCRMHYLTRVAELEAATAGLLHQVAELKVERDRLAARGDQFEAVLQQVVFSLERGDPGRVEGRIPMKADWEVALSMAKAALGHGARTGGEK